MPSLWLPLREVIAFQGQRSNQMIAHRFRLTKECFRICRNEIRSSGIFSRPSNARVFRPLTNNSTEEKEYVGHICMVIVLICLYGSAPHFFAPILFSQVCNLQTLQPNIDEVYDETLKNALKEFKRIDDRYRQKFF